MRAVSDTGPEVAVIRWPSEAAARTLLASAGTPRVLVVAEGVDVPPLLDELEDWLRDPVDPADLVARSDELRRRAFARARTPMLDEDGLLHFGGRWVVIPDAQLPIIELLLERFGLLVRTEELTEAYTAAGGAGNRGSIRTAIVRVRGRVEEIGLTLKVVRRRGVVLDVATR